MASASNLAASASEADRSALCAGEISKTSGKRIFAFRVDSNICCSKSVLAMLQTLSRLCSWIKSFTSILRCAFWTTSRTFLALRICASAPLKESFRARYKRGRAEKTIPCAGRGKGYVLVVTSGTDVDHGSGMRGVSRGPPRVWAWPLKPNVDLPATTLPLQPSRTYGSLKVA